MRQEAIRGFAPRFLWEHSARGLLVLGLLIAIAGGACERLASTNETATGVYEIRPSQHQKGAGRFYMGREIAEVIEHEEGMEWLERPGRETEEQPSRVLQALDLKASDVVADIGAGTGYFAFRLSKHVPHGRVLAVDIQEEMLEAIQVRIEAENVRNVEPVLGTLTNPNLPKNTVNVALIVGSYHEFSHPYEMVTHIVEALKPGGRLVLVEYRGEDQTIPVPPLHRMTEAQIRNEIEAAGLLWHETRDFLPQQHFIVFEKPIKNAILSNS